MQRNNLLILVADQLSALALRCYGGDLARTPNIDQLAENGVRFDAWTSCPLCLPARASFWTGRFPHETGVLSNGRLFEQGTIGDEVATLGDALGAAGYHCVHFGKTHDGGALRGFDCAPGGEVPLSDPGGFAYNHDSFRDEHTAQQAERFLGEHEGEDPWCCVVDLNNPHNICGFVAENHEGCIDGELPDLPSNFAADELDKRPAPVQYLCCSHRRQQQSAGWNEQQYRQYRAAYAHFTALADAQIGRVVEAMRQRADAERCTVLFFADHGDGMAAHQVITKHCTFYEETVKVPMIVAGAGVDARGAAVGDPMISLLDLFPTLADLAGAQIPHDLWGRSFARSLRGEELHEAHDYVVAEWHSEWGSTVEPGRMLRSPRRKYTRYRENDGEELFDLDKDPGKSRNLLGNSAYAGDLADMRRLLASHIDETDDPFAELSWQADQRWRSHALGYQRHAGECAPTAAGI